MYPSGGSEGFDMSQLLQQAQRMQEQLMSAQQDLAESEITGSAGGGLVRATMAGSRELTALHLDPSVVDPEDTETLADLIVVAVRDAHAEIQRRASEQLGSLGAEGLLGGGGLEGLFGEASLPPADEGDDDPERPDGSPGHHG